MDGRKRWTADRADEDKDTRRKIKKIKINNNMAFLRLLMRAVYDMKCEIILMAGLLRMPPVHSAREEDRWRVKVVHSRTQLCRSSSFSSDDDDKKDDDKKDEDEKKR